MSWALLVMGLFAAVGVTVRGVTATSYHEEGITRTSLAGQHASAEITHSASIGDDGGLTAGELCSVVADAARPAGLSGTWVHLPADAELFGWAVLVRMTRPADTSVAGARDVTTETLVVLRRPPANPPPGPFAVLEEPVEPCAVGLVPAGAL